MIKYVIAVDPGKATGIALLSYIDTMDNPQLHGSCEVQPHEFAPKVRGIIEQVRLEENFGIVCERFTINAQTVKNSQAPYSLEQIGVLKQVMRDFSIDENTIVWQTPADAKNLFPNPSLKKVGTWHVGGEGHANDAIRHGLLYLVKQAKWVPRVLLD
jgi:hypothetical protein